MGKITRKFKREYLIDELELPMEALDSEPVAHSRWSRTVKIRFTTPEQPDGTAWETTYECGASEYQEMRAWEYTPEVECVLVSQQPVTKMVWMPVEAPGA